MNNEENLMRLSCTDYKIVLDRLFMGMPVALEFLLQIPIERWRSAKPGTTIWGYDVHKAIRLIEQSLKVATKGESK